MQTLHIDKQNWQRSLAEAVTDGHELCRILHIAPDQLPHPIRPDRQFPVRVPLGYLARMTPGDPDDPLFLQVFASAREADHTDGYISDPVGDLAASRIPGLLQKYRGRALLVVTGACAIHCRYCFRRHYPYTDGMLKADQWHDILHYLEADPDIEEVILSGGDPLVLSNSKLQGLISALSAIPHIKRLRIHSRIPVVLPERIDSGLIDCLRTFTGQRVLVIHANHDRELDATVAGALNTLRQEGVTLLNQSVLLRGVNDQGPVLVALSKRLFASGVLPYYLHQLDKVSGAAHFQVSDEQALQLMAHMARELPGYLVPKLVREIAGEPGKRQITL